MDFKSSNSGKLESLEKTECLNKKSASHIFGIRAVQDSGAQAEQRDRLEPGHSRGEDVLDLLTLSDWLGCRRTSDGMIVFSL